LAQLNWTYVADSGKHFNVGLFHGPNTGHLMVHCNQQVVLVDFNVLDSKSYPLFLDDELFALRVELKKGQFSYAFEIDRKADTPRNRQRRQTERKHWRQAIAFFAGLAICAAMFTGLLMRYDAQQRAKKRASLIAGEGIETIAVINNLESRQGGTRIHFTFIGLGRIWNEKLDYDAAMPIILESGMPLQEGDEFALLYLGQDPRIWEIMLNRPSPGQLIRYRQQALNLHLALHPELARQHVECLLDIAYELHGIAGLAAFYFQEASAEAYPLANEITYKRIVRDTPFRQRAQRECW
jgi:hypothetical protein